MRLTALLMLTLFATSAVALDEHSYARYDRVRVRELYLDLDTDFAKKELAGFAELSLDWQDAKARTLDLDTRDLAIERGQIGISARLSFERVGPGTALAQGWDQTIGVMKFMVAGLRQIVVGERSVRELGGPIKIAKFSGESLAMGWPAFVSFAALISINLAFINLLPIPGLDGGHLAIYAAETIRRKPLDARSQEWAFRTGLALVLALMLFVTLNDIASLPIFGR